MPRPVDPTFIPVPMVDPRALARATSADDTRAEAAAREGLDVDVRKLGSAMRAYGAADSEGEETSLVETRSLVLSAAALALEQGEEGVLRLRAYELRSFLTEVRRWEITGEETSELRELGGGFLRMLRRSGWQTGDTSDTGDTDAAEGAPRAARRERRVLMDNAALRAAWKRRWNEIAGVRRPAFEPTLDEQRAFYRFVLEHPIGRPGRGLSRADSRAYEDQYRLKKIDEIRAIDASYPGDLARGVVLYRLGRHLLAVEAFRRHLDMSPDGPFTLRAQNYLRAALGRAQDHDQALDP